MRVAVIGLGNMGQALVSRLLDRGHELRVWNRSAGPSEELAARGAHILDTPDDADTNTDAVVLCLADDQSTLAVAAPDGAARTSWRGMKIVNTATVVPDTHATLQELYGARFVAALILGAPAAVEDGTARWILGGEVASREELQPLWNAFAATLDSSDSPTRAAAYKLLQNQMLLAGVATLAETVGLGRAAGFDEATLEAMLRSSPMVSPGVASRIDGLLDPDHEGWLDTSLGAKDLDNARHLDAAADVGYPVTEAAREGYRAVAADGWADADVTAIIERGTKRNP